MSMKNKFINTRQVFSSASKERIQYFYKFFTTRQSFPHCKMDIQEESKEQMTLQDFKMWTEPALKTFLSLRKKSVDGCFDTLVYR